jgi:replicative DNA helicase
VKSKFNLIHTIVGEFRGLSLITAKRGVGKSSILFDIACHASGKKVLFISSEMSEYELLRRLVLNDYGLTLPDLEDLEKEHEGLNQAIKIAIKRKRADLDNIKFIDLQSIDFRNFENYLIQEGFDCVIVDHAHAAYLPNPDKRPYHELLYEFLETVKKTSNKTEIPFLVGLQLHTQTGEVNNATQVGQLADLVLELQKRKSDIEAGDATTHSIFVRKARHGTRGIFTNFEVDLNEKERSTEEIAPPFVALDRVGTSFVERGIFNAGKFLNHDSVEIMRRAFNDQFKRNKIKSLFFDTNVTLTETKEEVITW